MKRTILTLTLAAQMAAGAAFAQTTTTEAPAGGMDESTQTFGSDWPTTLGLALFDEDGTTVRSEAEIATQWETLSDEDQNMIRRDCEMLPDQADASGSTGATGSTDTDATGTTGTSGSAMSGTTGSADSGSVDAMTDSPAQGATGADATAGAAAETATSDTSAGTATTSISVTTVQMTEICAATSDL